jgi:integrase
VRLDAHTTKNGEPRVFPFTAELETICPSVFQRNGERIITFRTAWKNACKAAGCPGKLIHDMRRSAVRTFERAGVPRSVAMSIVGHKTESIYRRYAIVDEAMQREAAARLDAWVSRSATAPIDVHRYSAQSRQSTPGPRQGVSLVIRRLRARD